MRHQPGKTPRPPVGGRSIFLASVWAVVSVAIIAAVLATSSPSRGDNSLQQRDETVDIEVDEPVEVDDGVTVEPEEPTPTPTVTRPEEIEIIERVSVEDSLDLPAPPVVATPASPDRPLEFELNEVVRVRDGLPELVSERVRPTAVPTEAPTGRATATPVSIEIDEEVGVGDSTEPDNEGGGAATDASPTVPPVPTATTVSGSPTPLVQPTSTVGTEPAEPSSGTCSASGGKADPGMLLLLGAPALFLARRKISRD